MSFAFSCPHCEKTLRTGKPVAEGKKLTCPKCGGGFNMADELIIEEDAEIIEDGEDGEEAAPSRTDTKVKKKKVAAKVEEDEDEDEEEGEEDGAAEKKPRKKAKAENGPIDITKPRKKKKKKKQNQGLLIGGIIVGALIFFGGFATLVYMMTMRTTLDIPMLAFAPTGTDFVIGADLGEISNHEKLKPQLQKIVSVMGVDFGKMKAYGLKDNDFNRLLVMYSLDKPTDIVITLRFNKPIEVEKMATALGGEKATVDEKTIYKTKEGVKKLLYFPEPDLMVMLPDTNAKTELLKRDITKSPLSDNIAKMTKNCWSNSLFISYVMSPKLALVAQSMNFTGNGKASKTPKAAGLGLRFGTESLEMSVILQMNSEAEAKEQMGNGKMDPADKTKMEQQINLLPSFELKSILKEALETYTLSRSGDTCYIWAKSNIDPFVKLINQATQLLGGLGGLGGGNAEPPPANGGRGGRGGMSGVGAGAGIDMPGSGNGP